MPPKPKDISAFPVADEASLVARYWAPKPAHRRLGTYPFDGSVAETIADSLSPRLKCPDRTVHMEAKALHEWRWVPLVPTALSRDEPSLQPIQNDIESACRLQVLRKLAALRAHLHKMDPGPDEWMEWAADQFNLSTAMIRWAVGSSQARLLTEVANRAAFGQNVLKIKDLDTPFPLRTVISLDQWFIEVRARRNRAEPLLTVVDTL